ncbi:MAG: N-acetylneuraminate synthase [bacterium]|nr:N-acetylneuraminate synthase [bacterium]
MIDKNHPCFIIAEAGVNHNGNPELAFQLIDIAAEAGVNAVKFQTFRAEDLADVNAPKAVYQQETVGETINQLEMLKQLELPLPIYFQLKEYAEKKGLVFLSSPFEEKSADFLVNELKVAAIKVPSGELTNFPFLIHLAKMGLPLIVSTGMATLEEVRRSVQIIFQNGNPPLALLHCTSSYPAPYDSINLRAMLTLEKEFQIPIGFSDHTEGIHIPIAAVALGACIIEKHFTIDRNLPGPDHKASLSPIELKAMVQGIRSVEIALGDGIKRPHAIEKDVTEVARKSLFTSKPLKKGSTITSDCLIARRPGTGIPPSELQSIVGKRILRDLPMGSMLRYEDLE